MNKLLALADRVEACRKGGLFSLDTEIAYALDLPLDGLAKPYTASLDAAMTLVPEGLWAEGSLSSPGQLEVHGPCTYDPLGKGWAATPALALVAAILRARAHGGGEG